MFLIYISIIKHQSVAAPSTRRNIESICNDYICHLSCTPCSLTTGIFLEPWRKSLLVALKKTAAPSPPTDFRPIALLCFLSKVLEKIVHDQIHGYLSSKAIMNPRQAGYRQHNSTQTALLRLTDDRRSDINNRKLTILLLSDFSKAFDTI